MGLSSQSLLAEARRGLGDAIGLQHGDWAATSVEALSGLTRVFIYAQARALLVSRWEVEPDATVKLITAAEMAGERYGGRAEAL